MILFAHGNEVRAISIAVTQYSIVKVNFNLKLNFTLRNLFREENLGHLSYQKGRSATIVLKPG